MLGTHDVMCTYIPVTRSLNPTVCPTSVLTVYMVESVVSNPRYKHDRITDMRDA